MSFFFSFLSFSFKLRERERERERERVYKIGYKEKQSQSYLSYLDGFLWRIFLLLRADRLYLIFNTGLKIRLLLVRDFFFVFFYPEYLALGSVRHESCPTTNFFLFYFRRREGFPTSVLGSQPIVWLLPSSFPCQATRVRSPSINIWSPLWPTFFLNGHSLMACYC